MKITHVVIGLIFNKIGEILVAERQLQKFQGGRFEFPGGKVEQGETPYEALKREFFEEVGIEILKATPWRQFQHEYPDRKILLDVWKVKSFAGVAHGKEGQIVRWVSRATLETLPIPDANREILAVL